MVIDTVVWSNFNRLLISFHMNVNSKKLYTIYIHYYAYYGSVYMIFQWCKKYVISIIFLFVFIVFSFALCVKWFQNKLYFSAGNQELK